MKPLILSLSSCYFMLVLKAAFRAPFWNTPTTITFWHYGERKRERDTHTHTHIRSHAENFCLCIMHNNTCLNGEGKRYGYLNVIVTTAPKARYWRKERSDERRIRRRKQLLVDFKETRRWWILERGSTRSHSPGELALKDVIGLSYKTTWWWWWW